MKILVTEAWRDDHPWGTDLRVYVESELTKALLCEGQMEIVQQRLADVAAYVAKLTEVLCEKGILELGDVSRCLGSSDELEVEL